MRILDLPLMRQRRLPTLLILLVGIAFPFLVITLVPYYHEADIAAFARWGDCLAASGTNVYLQCVSDATIPSLNYPSIGLILSGGAMQAIHSLRSVSGPAVLAVFRYYVAIFAALAFLLLVGLARMMRFKAWPTAALLILVVPSTLVGGILWGQLDGVSLVFCLIAFLGLLTARQATDRGRVWAMAGWTATGACGVVVLLLIKPLNTFALPFFVFFAFLVAVKVWRGVGWRGLGLAVAAWVAAVSLFRYLDTLFAVPPGFAGSTFLYSWSAGVSPHGDVLAGNGFNLWVLLGRDISSSSHAPFAGLTLAGRTYVFDPFRTGITLYALFLLATFVSALNAFWPRRAGPASSLSEGNSTEAPSAKGAIDDWLAPLLCLLFALTQIGFNVFVTGTHERYLFLGYPFLLIATLWLASRRLIIGWRGAVFCWTVVFLNGVFVYGAMHPLPGWLFPVWNNSFQATLHLVLLVFVFDVWFRGVRKAHATLSI